MSRISQDFIASVGYLYEEINTQQEDFLNEESEHYDAEVAELVEDIITSISLSMVYEGYSASAVVGFLADSSEEDILEKYLKHDDNNIFENIVDETYIKEQLEILDYLIIEGWREKVATAVGKFFAKRAPALSKGPGMLTQNAAYRLAMKGKPTLATKARVGLERAIGPKGRKAIQAIKDFSGKVKEALPKVAKYGLAGGAGVLAGYLGTKMGGAGEKTPESPKPSPSSKYNAAAALGGKAAFSAGGGLAKMKQNPNMTAADVQNQGMINIRNKKPPVAAPKPSPAPAPAAKPASTPEKPKDSTWTFNNKQVTDAEVNKKYQELRKTNPKAAEDFGRNVHSQKYGQLQQGPANAEIDKSSVEADIKAQQERDAERRKKEMEKAASSMKESYEPYEVLLEYLMSGGHADTIEEAHYIMLEMDASAVRAVMEEYEDYLLAEEVSEWVDGLLNEGYDLSEYSWDDIVEYYVNEANRGDEHVTSSMYMSREPETTAAKVRRRQKRDGLPDNASHQDDDKDYDRQWAHEVSRGRKKLKPISHDTLAKVKDKNPSGKYAAMQRRKKQGLG